MAKTKTVKKLTVEKLIVQKPTAQKPTAQKPTAQKPTAQQCKSVNEKKFSLTNRCKTFNGLINNKSKLRKYIEEGKKEQLVKFAGQFGPTQVEMLNKALYDLENKKRKPYVRTAPAKPRKSVSKNPISENDEKELKKKAEKIIKSLLKEGKTHEMLIKNLIEKSKEKATAKAISKAKAKETAKAKSTAKAKEDCKSTKIRNPKTRRCKEFSALTTQERLKFLTSKESDYDTAVKNYNLRNEDNQLSSENFSTKGRRIKSKDDSVEDDNVDNSEVKCNGNQLKDVNNKCKDLDKLTTKDIIRLLENPTEIDEYNGKNPQRKFVPGNYSKKGRKRKYQFSN